MAIMKIITVPDNRLRQKSDKVDVLNDQTKKLISDMLETLNTAQEPEGAGLAAPQVGVTKRIILAKRFIPSQENPEEVVVKDYVLVNPKLIKISKETISGWEACLSIPDVYGQVERPKKIKVSAQDENGLSYVINTSGFFARVILHEMDHLDGILFTDKVTGQTITEKEFDNLHTQMET